MKNTVKSIFSRSFSGFLAFMMVFTLLASLSMLPTFAATEGGAGERLFEDIYRDFYTNPDYAPSDSEAANGMINPDFTTPENRIKGMGEAAYKTDNFELYVDKISGEVALKDLDTGDIMFSNPYDIAEYGISGENSIAKSVKEELLSQVNISYNDNGQANSYNSFTNAALLGQITVKKLRGGVRVEYSIGEEETRNLVPRMMSKERYDEMIYSQLIANIPVADGETLDELTNPIVLKLTAFYEHIRIDRSTNEDTRKELVKQYPALNKYDERTNGIVVFTGEAYREIKQTERYIKTYCPKYTFEELDKDHMDTGYSSKDKAPANFRMALEYYITDMGLEVRFPANGLSFDETSYELTSISILPYMGAGTSDYTGYSFIPDGSGTLMRFEDVERYFTVTGKVYGDDYAYQEISSSNQEVFRMPVFGVVTSSNPMAEDGTVPAYKYEYKYQMTGGKVDTDELGNPIVVSKKPLVEKQKKEYATGYVAIVTEGDALATITSLNGGGDRHPFNSVYCSFNPRPKDSYNLSEAISVGGSGSVTVVSERKYTGAFKINYIMLSDENNPARANDSSRTFYDATYIGMAKAYRDFLVGKGTISKLTEEQVGKDIPFFIESFGVTETEESVLSLPVTVKKPLTTFEQLRIMVDECQKAGIANIGLRLTGFTNGGLKPTVPTKVKFEKVVGGNDEFVDFLKYAQEKGVSVYPEFDFAYMSKTGAFDGFSYSRDAVKTIDNRYITKREYTAVLQTFSTTGKICISPCVYRDYFESFDKSFKKILGDVSTNISAGTLGSDLNSDFDDDDPYNREDAKNFTLELLEQFDYSDKYNNIMIDAGNAYAMKYADIVLNAPLDSSRYSYSSEAIPFFGMVYHGYVVFAGSPTNMAGDIKYETLKILENGATLYMMLSYDNVELLKEDEALSKYYAVNYEIWKKTLFNQYDESGNLVSKGLYNKLNDALKLVQTSLIDDHGFISCLRQFTDAEHENIREDAQRYVDGELAARYALLQKWINKRDIYANYILKNKAALESYTHTNGNAYNLYDSKEILKALINVDANDSLTEARYNELVAYSTDTVVINEVILSEIVSFYNKRGDLTNKSLYEVLLAKYKEIAFPMGNSMFSEGIEVINGEIIKAQAEYDYMYNNGMADEVARLEATYRQNRIIDDGSVVFVEYDNGVWFILNYNSYNIEITAEDLEKAGFEIEADKFNADGMLIVAAKDFTMGGNK